MTWGSRLCRDCGNRFNFVRLDERLCQTCNASQSELTRVDRYVRSHPGESLTRVALATGVSEDNIRTFARAGDLTRIPRGAEPETTCGCPPDRPGTCPKCRAELASQLHDALHESHVAHRFVGTPETGPQRGGMTTRRHGNP